MLERLALAVLVLTLGACSTAADDTGEAAETTVAVTLADDAIALDPAEVPSGRILVEATNEGSMTHEIEIFAGAEEGVELPVEANVADTTGLTLLDEVEDIVPGATGTLTVELEPGTYLVVCNLPGHYAAGMSAFLTVTG